LDIERNEETNLKGQIMPFHLKKNINTQLPTSYKRGKLMGEIEELKAKFFRAYANLPEPEKVQIVIFIEDKTYSWEKVNQELINKTKLGDDLLKRMKYLWIL